MHEIRPAAGELLPAIARFRNAKGGVVGGGALLDDGLILTCAHVVNAALGKALRADERPGPDDLITVDFPLHAVKPAVARVVTWRPLVGFGEGDVAGVEIVEGHPAIPGMSLVGWSLRAAGPLALFGFPRDEPMGVWKRTVRAAGGMQGGWHQLAGPDPNDYKLQAGFSGCPVLRRDTAEVVAMFAQAEDAPEVDAGACIPVAKIVTTLADAEDGDRLTRLVQASSRAAQRDEKEQLERLGPVLALPMGVGGGLPTVAEVDMYDIGVSRSRYVTRKRPDPAYVRRTVDDELERVIEEEPFILLVGESKSGKSRTAFELLRRRRASAAFVAPSGSPSAPVQLLEIGIPAAADRIVLWLDDVDRYLAPNGLDPRVLAGLEQHIPPMTIVATIQSKRREAVLRAEGEVGRIAKAVLDRAYVVTVPRMLRPAERAAAQEAYPEEDFTDRGIGEQLVAAAEMERLYDDSRESEPRGWAVLQAAIDWRRAGIERPISRESLRSLFDVYLLEATPEFDPSDESFDVGLTWARQRVAGTLALVQPVQVDSAVAYRAFDYIVAYAEGQAHDTRDLPGSTWATVIDGVHRGELLTVAFEAFTRGNRTAALEAAGRVRDDDHKDTMTAWATILLADVEGEAGNYEAAEAFFDEAIASNDPDVVRVARLDLGSSLVNRGKLDEARPLLEAALASAGPELVTVAQATLSAALINGDESDRARARGLLEAALVSGDAQVVALAQANLSTLLLLGDASDRTRARGLLEAALASDNRQVVPVAEVNLGALLMAGDSQERARARTLLEAAIASGRSGVVSLAQVNLASLLLAGDAAERARARALLDEAVASGDPRAVPQAQVYLAAILLAGDEEERARAPELLEAALASGNRRAVPLAQAYLGLLLSAGSQDERERARGLLEAVLASGDPRVVTLAQASLGGILMSGDQNDRARARQMLEAALESQDPRVVPLAQSNMAALLIGGDATGRARARELLEAALVSGDPQAVPWARANLGGLLLSGDEAERARARELLEAALDSGDPRVLPIAQSNMAAVLMADDAAERPRARELLEAALASGDRQAVPLAQANLAALLTGGDAAEWARGRELLEAALSSGDPRVVPLAQTNLAAFLLTGDPDEKARGRDLLEAAVTSADSRVVPLAQANLGGALMTGDENDRARARELLEVAAESGVRDASAQARDLLGDLLTGEGDVEGAAAAYEAAIASGDPRWKPQAELDLAMLRIKMGEQARAGPLLEAAAGSDDPDLAPQAQYLLGAVRADAGDVEGAVAAYGAVIASGHVWWASQAQVDLAQLCRDNGDRARARELLELAMTSDHRRVVPQAQVLLASMLMSEDESELVRARELLEAAAASPEIEAAAEAHDRLGDLLAGLDDIDGAVAAYESAIASEDPLWSGVARIDLATLRWKAGDLDTAIALLRAASGSELPVVFSRAFAVLGDLLAYRGDKAGAEAAYSSAVAAGEADIAAAIQDRLEHPHDCADAVEASGRARITFLGDTADG